MMLAAGICSGPVVLKEDSPTAPRPRAGRVSGRIRPDRGLSRLRAVSRVTGKTYRPAAFQAKTGEFRFENLPGDARYDICFQTAAGREIEGIDLDFVDRNLVRLAAERRKQLGLPPEHAHEFSAGDVESLLKFVRDMKEFMELHRVLYIHGRGRRVTMLVEAMRTREFYAAGSSECIWRIELWYFLHQFGGWEKLAAQERVLRRVRAPRGQWSRISVEYYPQLSAYVSPKGESASVDLVIPARADSSRGRIAGTEAGIKTTTHTIGLPKKEGTTTRPATRPAERPSGASAGNGR